MSAPRPFPTVLSPASARPARRRPAWLSVPLLAMLLALLLLAPAPVHASLLHLEGPPPAELGVHDGHLAPCVSPSHCARADWSLDDPAAAVASLEAALAGDPAISLLERRNGYLHATTTSRIFGFVDDLELLADPSHGLLQARSASRLGESDLGVNARRLARLRDRLNSAPVGA